MSHDGGSATSHKIWNWKLHCTPAEHSVKLSIRPIHWTEVHSWWGCRPDPFSIPKERSRSRRPGDPDLPRCSYIISSMDCVAYFQAYWIFIAPLPPVAPAHLHFISWKLFPADQTQNHRNKEKEEKKNNPTRREKTNKQAWTRITSPSNREKKILKEDEVGRQWYTIPFKRHLQGPHGRRNGVQEPWNRPDCLDRQPCRSSLGWSE
jgi:hypothetical protein